MPHTKPRSRYRHPWKHGALLLILLSHAVFGSPVVPASSSSFSSVSSIPESRKLSQHTAFIPSSEEVFGPTLEKRADRKKRFLYEAMKKAKQAKLFHLGVASGNMAKQVGKSVLKTVATLGLKAIIFNFLYTKINQVLDFKTRLLNNLEHKNRDQNSQSGINSDSGTAGSTVSTTENTAEQIPEFQADKVSLQVPDAVFGPAFNIANGASQVLGTLIQNTALRIAKMFEALKPLLRSSSSLRGSKKRETDLDVDEFLEDTKSASSESKEVAGKSPIKSSYVALTQSR